MGNYLFCWKVLRIGVSYWTAILDALHFFNVCNFYIGFEIRLNLKSNWLNYMFAPYLSIKNSTWKIKQIILLEVWILGIRIFPGSDQSECEVDL